MKDITLKIIGKQVSGDQAEEQMEFVTEGKLYERGQSLYLVYDESEFSGFPGCKTSLKLSGESVRMKRVGKEAGMGAELTFEKGKRILGKYDTPYGPLDMEVLTNDVKNNLSKEGIGNIEIDYHVSLQGMVEGRNHLQISVTETGNQRRYEQ